jgi:hypothetical protein
VVPGIQSEHQGLLIKDWIPLALNKSDWLNNVNAYFECCKTIDKDHEEEKNPNNIGSQETVTHIHTYGTDKT